MGTILIIGSLVYVQSRVLTNEHCSCRPRNYSDEAEQAPGFGRCWAAEVRTFLFPSHACLQQQTFKMPQEKNARGVRSRIKGHMRNIWSRSSKNNVDAIESDGARQSQEHQEQTAPRAPLDSGGWNADQANSNDTTVKRTTPENHKRPLDVTSTTPIRELWTVAYEKLREEDSALITDYEAKLRGNIAAGLRDSMGLKPNVREQMRAILESKMEEVNKDAWKFNWGNSEVKVKDVAQVVVGIVGSVNDYIKDATSTNPYASIAWTGISFLLPVSWGVSVTVEQGSRC